MASGTYTPKREVKLTHWPLPDKDGDGDPVYDDDDREVKDRDGNPVKNYLPPEGFNDIPGDDNKSHWVRSNKRGQVQRDSNGEAVHIVEGGGVLDYPDGSSVSLSIAETRAFLKSHDLVGNVETAEVPDNGGQ